MSGLPLLLAASGGMIAAEGDLLDWAGRWPGCSSWTDLTEEVLREIAARHGMEFATALLYDRIVRSAEHGPFLERLMQMPDTVRSSHEVPWTVALVPGAFYAEYPGTGADGRFLLDYLAGLGYHAERIPLESFGRLPDNARRIGAWLEEHREEKIVLVSLSKGGAEVKLALAQPDAAERFRNVAAWINLSGTLQGAPIVGWLRRHRWRSLLVRLLFRYRGYRFGVLRELERGPGCLLDFDLGFPDSMQVIHLVGFPMVRHLSSGLARRGYRRLAPLGPNDGGGIVLADVGRLRGLIYPMWGADHYLRPTWDLRPLVWRLLRYVEEEISRQGAKEERKGAKKN